jgi:hypothetical protein
MCVGYTLWAHVLIAYSLCKPVKMKVSTFPNLYFALNGCYTSLAHFHITLALISSKI